MSKRYFVSYMYRDTYGYNQFGSMEISIEVNENDSPGMIAEALDTELFKNGNEWGLVQGMIVNFWPV